MLYNERGHLDPRDAIGLWSFIKWILDSAFVILGIIFGGKMLVSAIPVPAEFAIPALIAFGLYLWSFAKEIVDTPLVILWMIAKWKHIQRAQKKRKRKESLVKQVKRVFKKI